MGHSRAPWHAWYNTARWRKLRLKVFLRDLFTCRKCGRIQGNTSLLVCDHIKAHRGDERLFWDDANLQSLCKSCHDTIKQREEQATLNERGVWDLDPSALFWPTCAASSAPLVIVFGPPAAGKSTLVAAERSPNDIVIDLDDIVAELFPNHPRTRSWPMRSAALRERNRRLQGLARSDPAVPCAWFLTGAPKLEDRHRWEQMLHPQRTIVMATPADVCIERIRADPHRMIGAQDQIDAVTAWWAHYLPS